MRVLTITLRLTAILTTITLVSSCKKNPVAPSVTPNVQLTAAYVGCTEVWLTIGFADSPGGGEYRISRDGSTVLTGTIYGANRVVYDTTVQARKNYSYTAYKLKNGQVFEISSPLQVMTLDSTSHNFNWQIYTFGGDGASCWFSDVAIVNDTTIYAVGRVYLRDSSGQVDPHAYNLLSGNGKNWRLNRVYFGAFCGYPNLTPYPTSAILPLSNSDIWIAGGGQVIRWNGNSQSTAECVDPPNSFEIYRMWGTDSNSVYVVGLGGNIAHFDGTNWHKLESGTIQPINDIWGDMDPFTGKTEILAIASNKLSLPVGKKVLRIDGGTVTTVSDSALPWSLSGIWFMTGRWHYIAGDGLFKNSSSTVGIPWLPIDRSLTNYYTEAIRGTAANDVMVAGDFGVLLHYNGSTWFNYQNQVFLPSGLFYALAMKANVAVAVGGSNNAAIIAIGHR